MARTVPSLITKPSFMESGIVRQWLVKPDDYVKKGQLLGREDTDVEELKLRSERIQADSMAAVEAATADRDARKIEYESKLKAYSLQATSADEVEEAKLDYEQKEAVLRNAQAQREKYLADVDIQARSSIKCSFSALWTAPSRKSTFRKAKSSIPISRMARSRW